MTDVKSVDPYTLEVCLSVDDTLPACSASSLQGQLRSVFMDSRGFGVSDPGDISIEDGTIELTRPYCRGEGLLACQGQNVSGVASPVGLPSFNQAFTVRNTVAWTGTRQTALGCFYVKRVDGLQFSPPAPPGSGWSMAFTYSDTEGGRHAVSAAKLCRSDPPVLSEVNAERTVISTRLPSDSGDAPLVCVVVRPPVAVDRSTTAICLDTTTQVRVHGSLVSFVCLTPCFQSMSKHLPPFSLHTMCSTRDALAQRPAAALTGSCSTRRGWVWRIRRGSTSRAAPCAQGKASRWHPRTACATRRTPQTRPRSTASRRRASRSRRASAATC